MTNNTINDEINEMRQYLSKQLPNWEKTTAETLLTALSNCDNQQVKESAGLIKLSSKSEEMMMLLDFKKTASANNWLWWLFYRIPGKEELKKKRTDVLTYNML